MSDSSLIHAAMAKVQASVEDVGKTKTADTGSYKYKYADLAQVLQMLRPILKENGLAVLQRPTIADGRFVLQSTILHESGQEMDAGTYPLGEYSKSQDLGKAITYARRYSLCALFGVAQDDDDAQGVEAKKPATAPIAKPIGQRVNAALDKINKAKTVEEVAKIRELSQGLIKDAEGTESQSMLIDALDAKEQILMDMANQVEEIMNGNQG